MSIEDTVKAIKTSVVNSDIQESVAKNAKRNIKGAEAEIATEDSSQVEFQSENASEESSDTSGKGVSIPDTAKTATEEYLVFKHLFDDDDKSLSVHFDSKLGKYRTADDFLFDTYEEAVQYENDTIYFIEAILYTEETTLHCAVCYINSSKSDSDDNDLDEYTEISSGDEDNLPELTEETIRLGLLSKFYEYFNVSSYQEVKLLDSLRKKSRLDMEAYSNRLIRIYVDKGYLRTHQFRSVHLEKLKRSFKRFLGIK